MLQKSTVFNAQNAGNRISELLDFKLFWEGHVPRTPYEKGALQPFSGHSRLLHLQWPLITKVIEPLSISLTAYINRFRPVVYGCYQLGLTRETLSKAMLLVNYDAVFSQAFSHMTEDHMLHYFTANGGAGNLTEEIY